MAEGPAVAEVEAEYGDRVQFVGIGGQANPGADLAGFVAGTGTDGFPQLDDESGELWERFGTGGRSTFMFVNQDGTFELTTYGVVDNGETGRSGRAADRHVEPADRGPPEVLTGART